MKGSAFPCFCPPISLQSFQTAVPNLSQGYLLGDALWPCSRASGQGLAPAAPLLLHLSTQDTREKARRVGLGLMSAARLVSGHRMWKPGSSKAPQLPAWERQAEQLCCLLQQHSGRQTWNRELFPWCLCFCNTLSGTHLSPVPEFFFFFSFFFKCVFSQRR